MTKQLDNIPNTSPREESDSKQRVIDSALALFAQHGYDATSVRQIIDAAGVTQPVLYYYFKNKKDLFRQLITQQYENSFEQIKTAMASADNCIEKLRAFIQTSFAGCVANLDATRLIFQTYFGPPVKDVHDLMQYLSGIRFLMAREIIHEGLETAVLRGDNPDALTLVFCCLVDQHINTLSRLPDAATHLTHQLADYLLDVFLHGLHTPNHTTTAELNLQTKR